MKLNNVITMALIWCNVPHIFPFTSIKLLQYFSIVLQHLKKNDENFMLNSFLSAKFYKCRNGNISVTI